MTKVSSVDALMGHTRSHPEHDGKDLSGRWYCIGDDVGEQVGAGSKEKNLPVVMRLWETPVPIPNTTVKT